MTTLAETLFIEMVDGNPSLSDETVKSAAAAAVRYARLFNQVEVDSIPEPWQLRAHRSSSSLVGCRVCHGSGGKRSDPCAACAGTGKVAKL